MTALKDRFWAKVLFSQFIKHYRKMTPEQKVADIDASMDALEELDDTGDSFGAKMVRWSMERVNQYPQASENGKKGGRPKKKQETTADAPTREDGEFKSDSGDAGNLESATSANHYGDSSTSDSGEACTCRESGVAGPTTVSKNMRRVPQNEAPAHGFSGGRTAQGTMSRSPEAAAQSGKDYDQETYQVSTDGPRQAEDRQSQGRTGAPSTGATSSTAPVRSLPMPTTEQLYDFARAESIDEADARDWYEMTVVDRGGKDRNGNRITNWKAACKKFCVARAQRRTA